RQISRGDGNWLFDPAPPAAKDGCRLERHSSPDRQMVAGLACLATGVHPGCFDRQRLVDENPVERRDWPAGMEAWTGRGDAVAAIELSVEATGVAPFVGIPHHDRRHLLRPLVD